MPESQKFDSIVCREIVVRHPDNHESHLTLSCTPNVAGLWLESREHSLNICHQNSTGVTAIEVGCSPDKSKTKLAFTVYQGELNVQVGDGKDAKLIPINQLLEAASLQETLA